MAANSACMEDAQLLLKLCSGMKVYGQLLIFSTSVSVHQQQLHSFAQFITLAHIFRMICGTQCATFKVYKDKVEGMHMLSSHESMYVACQYN